MRIPNYLLTDDEIRLLSEMARRLAPHTNEIVNPWAEIWIETLPIDGADPDAYRQMVRFTLGATLSRTLELLSRGRVDLCFEEQYSLNRGFLENQMPSSAMPVFTQDQMHEVAIAGRPVMEEWIARVFADDPVTALRALLAQEKFGGHMGAILSQVYADERESRLTAISTKLEQALNESEQLRRLLNAITESLELDSLIPLTLETTMTMLNADGASLALLEDASANVRMWHLENGNFTERCVSSDGTLMEWLLQHDRTIRIPPVPDGVNLALPQGTRALVVPLRALGKPIGAITALRRSGRIFSERTEGLLRGLADTVTAAIRNARAHTEIRDALEAAKQANRAKSEFVAAVVHEVRSPLNALLGYADLLCEGAFGDLDGEQQEIVQRLASIARSTITLTNDLLDQARIEAGLFPVSLQEISLGAIIDELRAVVEPSIQDKDVVFRAEILPGAEHVWADPVRVRQVLTNLVTNAVKFTPAGVIELQAAPRGGLIAVAVRDSGMGIAPEALEKLFTLFYRGDQQKSGIAGAGIGLFLSRHLAQLMGGGLEVESQVGKGSTFTLTLPRHAPAAEGN